jgi:hypothetical protein
VPRLFIIDGAKALSKAIRRTVGRAAPPRWPLLELLAGQEAFARSVCSTKSAEWSKYRPHSPPAGESTGIVEATEPDRLPPFR